MTCLWTRSGRCRNNPLKMAYTLWALCKVSALVGTLKTVSEVFSICSSSASKPLSAKISQALKENAKSRQQFWSSSEVGYPKNSGHLTTFEASEKLLRFFASDTSFIVRAASAADWAALAALVINSTSASGAAAAMLEASSTKQWRHYGVSKGARPVWNPSLLRIGSSPREGFGSCPLSSPHHSTRLMDPGAPLPWFFSWFQNACANICHPCYSWHTTSVSCHTDKNSWFQLFRWFCMHIYTVSIWRNTYQKHTFLIVVADRQQRKALAVHHCILASQSPLTGSCSGVQFKTKWICRVLNVGFRSRESILLAARLLLYRPPCGEQLRGSVKDSHIKQGRWPVVVRH